MLPTSYRPAPFTRVRNALQNQAPHASHPSPCTVRSTYTLHLTLTRNQQRSTSSMTSDTSPTVRPLPPGIYPPELHSRRPQYQPSPGDGQPAAVPSRLWRRTFIHLFPHPTFLLLPCRIHPLEEVRHPFIPLVSAFLSLSFVPESRTRAETPLPSSVSLPITFPFSHSQTDKPRTKKDAGTRIPYMLYPTFPTPSPPPRRIKLAPHSRNGPLLAMDDGVLFPDFFFLFHSLSRAGVSIENVPTLLPW